VLANSFWKRWISEYLPTLQLRQKWRKQARNVQVKDLVLLVDSGCSRGQEEVGQQAAKHHGY
jgi:hypothetical protein